MGGHGEGGFVANFLAGQLVYPEGDSQHRCCGIRETERERVLGNRQCRFGDVILRFVEWAGVIVTGHGAAESGGWAR